MLAITGSGSREAWTFDHDPNLAAKLHVDFDTRDPLEIALDQPFLVQPIAYSNTDGTTVDGVHIQSKRLALELNGPELDYLIETSNSLMPNSWTALPDSELVKNFKVTVFPWLGITVEFPAHLLPDAAEHFFRLRITKIAAFE